MLPAMRRLLTPITIAASGGALLVGAAGGAVVASAAENPAPKPVAPIFGACVDQAVKDGKLTQAEADAITKAAAAGVLMGGGPGGHR